MSLEIRYAENNTPRPNWYGVSTIDGTRKVFKLQTLICGVPSLNSAGRISLKQKGDMDFEISRAKAEKELEQIANECSQKGDTIRLIRKQIEIKSGQKTERVKVCDMATVYNAKKGAGNGAKWQQRYTSICNAFAGFVGGNTYADNVTAEQVQSFMRSISTFSIRNQKIYLVALKAMFSRCLPSGYPSPCQDIQVKATNTEAGETIHRMPFTAQEITRLFSVAEEDDFLYPLIITACCTGLRIGDVCNLSWKSVDLRNNVLNVRTSKTGATVSIPIFKPLKKVLSQAQRTKTDSLYVFPIQKDMYARSPDQLTRKYKAFLVQRFFTGDTTTNAIMDIDACMGDVIKAINASTKTEARKQQMIDAVREYAETKNIGKVAVKMCMAKASMSYLFNDVQTIAGIQFLKQSGNGLRSQIAKHTQVQAEGRRNKASVIDWHSLRSTFVVIALMSGISIEVLRKITGHATVDVVLSNYFNPRFEQTRNELEQKLPSILTM